MSALASEFQDVFQLYLRLCEELTKIMNADSSNDSGILAESILQNRDHLDRIEQMNSRVLRLTDDWVRCRPNLDPKSQNEIQALAGDIRAQAIRLKELCGFHAQKLQRERDKLEQELTELGKGARYLESVKPVKNNYPKFIDSLY